MKNLLEILIKNALFEAPTTKAKLRSMDSADFLVAKRAGAVFAYYAVVKGVNDEKSLINAVAGATLGSQDSETSTGVGASGQYANGKFVYVVNTEDVARKNVVAVYIMPNDFKKSKTNTATQEDPSIKAKNEPEVEIKFFGLKIGQSDMISKTSYDKRKLAAQKSDASINATPLEMPSNTTGMQKVIDAVKSAVSTDKPTDALPTDPVAKPADTSYPRDINGVKVYTMSDTDPYVYAKIDNVWKYLDKKSFETNPLLTGFSKPMNRAGITNIEKKFNLTTVAPAVVNTANTGTDVVDNSIKKGTTLRWASAAGTNIPYFLYNTSTKKFVKQTNKSFKIGNELAKYQSTSKGGTYYLVDIDGTKVYFEKKYFK